MTATPLKLSGHTPPAHLRRLPLPLLVHPPLLCGMGGMTCWSTEALHATGPLPLQHLQQHPMPHAQGLIPPANRRQLGNPGASCTLPRKHPALPPSPPGPWRRLQGAPCCGHRLLCSRTSSGSVCWKGEPATGLEHAAQAWCCSRLHPLRTLCVGAVLPQYQAVATAPQPIRPCAPPQRQIRHSKLPNPNARPSRAHSRPQAPAFPPFRPARPTGFPANNAGWPCRTRDWQLASAARQCTLRPLAECIDWQPGRLPVPAVASPLSCGCCSLRSGAPDQTWPNAATTLTHQHLARLHATHLGPPCA